MLILILASLLIMSQQKEMHIGSLELASQSEDVVYSMGLTDDLNNNITSEQFSEILKKYDFVSKSVNPTKESCGGQWPCTEPNQDYRYESCNPNAANGYLENQFQTAQKKYKSFQNILAQDETDSSNKNQIINRQCFRAAMDRDFFKTNNKNTFKKCDSLHGTIKKAVRPCISENYFESVEGSFNLVSQCMKNYIAPNANESIQNKMIQSVFKMISLESGFHINAFSGTGAGGLGQLTSSAIEDINSKQLGKIRRHLENESADSKCATLSQEILTGKTPMKAQASLSCERISIENGNPLLNMIYTMAYFKQSRSMIQNRILNDSRFKSVLALSQNDLELLDSELGVWSHNAGAGGITKPTIALLNEYAMQGEKVTDVKKFLSELELFAFEMPHPANRSLARRLETSTYYKKIQSTAQNIEKSVGVRSCLNQ